MTTMNIYDLTDTWNAAGTTFNAIKMNVTDTASAAGSLLMDLQVGGASKFSISKAGSVLAPIGSAAAPTFAFGVSNTGWYSSGSGSIVDLSIGGTQNLRFSSNGMFFTTAAGTVQVSSGGSFSFSSGTAGAASADTILARDAADTLAQRRGTNAQAFRLYGTYTDASNLRRLVMNMSAGGVAEIKPEGLGTGASGNVLHISGLPTANPGPGILWNNAGTVEVGT